MSTAAEQKQAMTDYFDQNGTLRGFSGKMPSVQDFYKAMEGDSLQMGMPSMSAIDAEIERRRKAR
jgi:hypothetical protein